MLLYADDIVMMAKTEDLQTILDTLYSWCKRWRVLIKCGKIEMHALPEGAKTAQYL